MRILILGGDGMLGHRVLDHFSSRHETGVTLRKGIESYSGHGIFDVAQTFAGIDVRHEDNLLGVFAEFRPEAVINAIGIVKQRDEAKAALPSLELNAVFPHRLSNICSRRRGAHDPFEHRLRLFRGSRAVTRRMITSDARDLYGRTKYLGEVSDDHCVTLRTSIIGLEFSRKASLIEWFLAQRGNHQWVSKGDLHGFHHHGDGPDHRADSYPTPGSVGSVAGRFCAHR